MSESGELARRPSEKKFGGMLSFMRRAQEDIVAEAEAEAAAKSEARERAEADAKSTNPDSYTTSKEAENAIMT